MPLRMLRQGLAICTAALFGSLVLPGTTRAVDLRLLYTGQLGQDAPTVAGLSAPGAKFSLTLNLSAETLARANFRGDKPEPHTFTQDFFLLVDSADIRLTVNGTTFPAQGAGPSSPNLLRFDSQYSSDEPTFYRGNVEVQTAPGLFDLFVNLDRDVFGGPPGQPPPILKPGTYHISDGPNGAFANWNGLDVITFENGDYVNHFASLDSTTLTVSAVPEAHPAWLLLFGSTALAWSWRRRVMDKARCA